MHSLFLITNTMNNDIPNTPENNDLYTVDTYKTYVMNTNKKRINDIMKDKTALEWQPIYDEMIGKEPLEIASILDKYAATHTNIAPNNYVISTMDIDKPASIKDIIASIYKK